MQKKSEFMRIPFDRVFSRPVQEVSKHFEQIFLLWEKEGVKCFLIGQAISRVLIIVVTDIVVSAGFELVKVPVILLFGFFQFRQVPLVGGVNERILCWAAFVKKQGKECCTCFYVHSQHVCTYDGLAALRFEFNRQNNVEDRLFVVDVLFLGTTHPHGDWRLRVRSDIDPFPICRFPE